MYQSPTFFLRMIVSHSSYSVQLPLCTELSSTQELHSATVFHYYRHYCSFMEILGYMLFSWLHVNNYHMYVKKLPQ